MCTKPWTQEQKGEHVKKMLAKYSKQEVSTLLRVSVSAINRWFRSYEAVCIVETKTNRFRSGA